MSLRLDDPLSVSVSQAVLGIESNDGRFERFCNDVVSALEGGATVLSTSKSWDLGRDGVGFGRASGIYVLSSLRDDPDVKTLTDLQRIVETTRDVRLAYFCSTQRLSEQARSKIEANLRREAEDKFTIRALGAAQLCEVALAHPGMLEKFYGAEISNCLRSIHADPDDDTELKGLRIALIASAGNDSVAIRREIYCASILDALADKKPRTLTSCAKDISDNLQLQRNIDVEAVRPYISSLVVDGFVTEKDGVVAITSDGSARIAARQLDAANRLLRGRADIRDALEASLEKSSSMITSMLFGLSLRNELPNTS